MKRAIFVITPLLAALLLLLPQRHHAQTLLTGANRPTVQSVVTGSRSFGVAYQNTLTTPMWVNVSAPMRARNARSPYRLQPDSFDSCSFSNQP